MRTRTRVQADPGLMMVIHEWRRWLRGQGLAESTTLQHYAYGVWRLFISSERLGEPADVQPADIDDFLASLGTKGSARAVYMHGICSFFGFCQRRGYVEADPTAELKAVRQRKPSHRPQVVLSEDELRRLCIAAAWRDPKRAWAIILAFSTGCRRGEIGGIAPRDVFSDEILIRHAKGGRWRRVPLNDLARTALEELRPWSTEESIIGVNSQTFSEWCHDAAVDAELEERVKGRPAHVLRASFATHLLRKGVPVQVVRDLLGHRSIETTNIYAVSDPTDRQAAVERGPFTI
jgi:integrase/recombinase XerD